MKAAALPAAAARPFPPAAARPVLLPRLAIHAFCEDQATAELIRTAGCDRRLIRAQSNVQMGGVHQACAVYERQASPSLIIVESLLSSREMLADLERLAMLCEPETKVLVIGHVNDVLLYRDLVRRGVNDYLVPPFTAEELAGAIAAVCAGDHGLPPGRVMAFIGARGGAGSSTVAHNVGWTFAEALETVSIIADLDIAFGTAGLNFNQDAGQGAAQALAITERLDERVAEKLLAKCSDRLSLLGASGDLAQMPEIAPEAAIRLVEALSRSAAAVILDLPRQWSPWLRQLLIHVDEVVITAEPDLANLRNAKNLIDTLTEHRTRDRAACLVLNKVSMGRRQEIAPRDFAGAVGIDPGVVIEFDPALFGAAANSGLMIGEVSRKARPAEQFRTLAGMLARKVVLPPQSDGFLAPILSRLARRRGRA